jgi:SPP1 family holin
MNRLQSIVSGIVSFICVFIVPELNRRGIIIDETAVSSIVCGIIAIGAFIWTAWKNHNITESAMEAQAILDELKQTDGIVELDDEFEDEEEEVEE